MRVNSIELFQKSYLEKLCILPFHFQLLWRHCQVYDDLSSNSLYPSLFLSQPSDKFYRSGRKKKKTVLERGVVQHLILCTPSPQIKTILWEVTKRRESTNRKQTVDLNCSDYFTHDKMVSLSSPSGKGDFSERGAFSWGYWGKSALSPTKYIKNGRVLWSNIKQIFGIKHSVKWSGHDWGRKLFMVKMKKIIQTKFNNCGLEHYYKLNAILRWHNHIILTTSWVKISIILIQSWCFLFTTKALGCFKF